MLPKSSMSNSKSLVGFTLQESTKFSFLSSSVSEIEFVRNCHCLTRLEANSKHWKNVRASTNNAKPDDDDVVSA